MDIRSLSDSQLLTETKRLAAQEREVLTQVLHHLFEVDSRRLFSTLKYPSIFEYAVRELKYSEGQAARRVQAMRALAALPEIETKIASGELSLSNVAMVQSAFSKSGKKLDRREMLKSVENKTTREAEKIIGLPQKRELTIDMIGDEALREKAKAVIGKFAHSKLSFEQVLHKLFDRELGSKCCSICGSTYALQTDHIFPRAKGGGNSKDNLRLLCRKCNQRSAIEHFGLKQMRRYFDTTDWQTI